MARDALWVCTCVCMFIAGFALSWIAREWWEG